MQLANVGYETPSRVEIEGYFAFIKLCTDLVKKAEQLQRTRDDEAVFRTKAGRPKGFNHALKRLKLASPYYNFKSEYSAMSRDVAKDIYNHYLFNYFGEIYSEEYFSGYEKYYSVVRYLDGRSHRFRPPTTFSKNNLDSAIANEFGSIDVLDYAIRDVRYFYNNILSILEKYASGDEQIRLRTHSLEPE